MRKRTENKGFTLIEILISIAVLGIVLAALMSLFISSNKNASAQNLIVTMQGNSRSSMDFVVRTLNGLMRTNPAPDITGEGTCTGTNVCNSEISFTADENAFGGPTSTHAFRRHTSSSDGANTLGYASPGTGSIVSLAPNIVCFGIQRRDKNNAVTTSWADTARLDVSLTAETITILPDTGSKGRFTLTSSVFLRN